MYFTVNVYIVFCPMVDGGGGNEENIKVDKLLFNMNNLNH